MTRRRTRSQLAAVVATANAYTDAIAAIIVSIIAITASLPTTNAGCTTYGNTSPFTFSTNLTSSSAPPTTSLNGSTLYYYPFTTPASLTMQQQLTTPGTSTTSINNIITTFHAYLDDNTPITYNMRMALYDTFGNLLIQSINISLVTGSKPSGLIQFNIDTTQSLYYIQPSTTYYIACWSNIAFKIHYQISSIVPIAIVPYTSNGFPSTVTNIFLPTINNTGGGYIAPLDVVACTSDIVVNPQMYAVTTYTNPQTVTSCGPSGINNNIFTILSSNVFYVSGIYNYMLSLCNNIPTFDNYNNLSIVQFSPSLNVIERLQINDNNQSWSSINTIIGQPLISYTENNGDTNGCTGNKNRGVSISFYCGYSTTELITINESPQCTYNFIWTSTRACIGLMTYSIINITSFELPLINIGSYIYYNSPTGQTPSAIYNLTINTPWIFQGESGIASIGSSWDPLTPNNIPPNGNQYVFLQTLNQINSHSSISTNLLNLFINQSYFISFYYNQRHFLGINTNITLKVMILTNVLNNTNLFNQNNNNITLCIIPNITIITSGWIPVNTSSFIANTSAVTLLIYTTSYDTTDHSILIDQVTVNAVINVTIPPSMPSSSSSSSSAAISTTSSSLSSPLSLSSSSSSVALLSTSLSSSSSPLAISTYSSSLSSSLSSQANNLSSTASTLTSTSTGASNHPSTSVISSSSQSMSIVSSSSILPQSSSSLTPAVNYSSTALSAGTLSSVSGTSSSAPSTSSSVTRIASTSTPILSSSSSSSSSVSAVSSSSAISSSSTSAKSSIPSSSTTALSSSSVRSSSSTSSPSLSSSLSSLSSTSSLSLPINSASTSSSLSGLTSANIGYSSLSSVNSLLHSSSLPLTLTSSSSSLIPLPTYHLLCTVSPSSAGIAYLTSFNFSCFGANIISPLNLTTSLVVSSYTFAYQQYNTTNIVQVWSSSSSSATTYLPTGTIALIATANVTSLNQTLIQQIFTTIIVVSPVLSTSTNNTNTSAAANATAAAEAACVLQECISNALSADSVASQSLDQTLALAASLAAEAAAESASNIPSSDNPVCGGSMNNATSNTSTNTTSSSISDTILSVLSTALTSSLAANSTSPLTAQSIGTIASTLATVSSTLTSVNQSAVNISSTINTVLAITSAAIDSLSSVASSTANSTNGFYTLVANSTGQSILDSIAATISNVIQTAAVSSTITASNNGSAATTSVTRDQCSILSSSTSLVNALLAAGLSGATASANTSSSVSLNSASFNASSTTLAAGNDASVTSAANVNITVPSSALSTSAGETLDLRIISIDASWSACYTSMNNTNTSTSSIYTIDITTSNGTIVSTSNIEPPLSFSFPASYSTEATSNNTNQCNSDGNVYMTIPVCSYIDPSTGLWLTNGCTTTTNSITGVVTCLCTHLTEFALLYAKAVYPCTSIVIQSYFMGYLIVMVLYIICILVSSIQLIRMRWYSQSCCHILIGQVKGSKPTLLLIQHSLIVIISIIRLMASIIDYTQYPISYTVSVIIALLPYVGSTLVLSLTVVQWMIVYHHTAVTQNISTFVDKNLINRLRFRLFASNMIIAILVTLLYIGIFFTSNTNTFLQASLAILGIVICSIFVAGLGLCFAIYGFLLVKSLTADQFSSRHASRLLSLSIIFTCLLFTQSIIQLNELITIGTEEYDTDNVIYYCLDVSGLYLIMIMFSKSVTDFCNVQLSHMRRSTVKNSILFSMNNNNNSGSPTLANKTLDQIEMMNKSAPVVPMFESVNVKGNNNNNNNNPRIRSQNTFTTTGVVPLPSSRREEASLLDKYNNNNNNNNNNRNHRTITSSTSSSFIPAHERILSARSINFRDDNDTMEMDEFNGQQHQMNGQRLGYRDDDDYGNEVEDVVNEAAFGMRSPKKQMIAPAPAPIRERRSSWVMIKQSIQSVTERLRAPSRSPTLGVELSQGQRIQPTRSSGNVYSNNITPGSSRPTSSSPPSTLIKNNNNSAQIKRTGTIYRDHSNDDDAALDEALEDILTDRREAPQRMQTFGGARPIRIVRKDDAADADSSVPPLSISSLTARTTAQPLVRTKTTTRAINPVAAQANPFARSVTITRAADKITANDI